MFKNGVFHISRTPLGVEFMSYERLLPSMADYFQKFKRLDSLDFKIVRAMLEKGVHNLHKLAETVNAPQQTVSYRIRRFDREDIVRFRALVNEAKLGLKSYSVLASVPMAKEDASGCALTCFPLWRYLATVDGWRDGNYVRYAVPPDKERDLKAFLEELRRRTLISDFETYATSGPKYPLLDLDFYARTQRASVFDWQGWVSNFDSFPPEDPAEPEDYGRAEFDMIDLIILRCLELNARTTQRDIVARIEQTLGDKNGKKFIPMVSRRINKNINPQGLIYGYRAYLFPNQEQTAMLFLFYLDFPNDVDLRRFTGALQHLPYNASYERILEKNALFVRLVVPAFECSSMRKSIRDLAERGCIKTGHTLLGELSQGTWDNVEIHQMFKDGAWNFSYGAAIEMLEDSLRTLDKNLKEVVR
jgi:DNA-binding Lrp family transcriptional regulator